MKKDKIKWIKDEKRTSCESLLGLTGEDKTAALVIRRGIDDKWVTVGVTAFTESGSWVSGMTLLTSIDDVLDTAEKHNLNIIFEKTLIEIDPGEDKFTEKECQYEDKDKKSIKKATKR